MGSDLPRSLFDGRILSTRCLGVQSRGEGLRSLAPGSCGWAPPFFLAVLSRCRVSAFEAEFGVSWQLRAAVRADARETRSKLRAEPGFAWAFVPTVPAGLPHVGMSVHDPERTGHYVPSSACPLPGSRCGASLPPEGRNVDGLERLDDQMADVLRERSGAQRLAIAHEMFESARRMLASHLTAEHPDWDAERIAQEVARRLSHGSG